MPHEIGSGIIHTNPLDLGADLIYNKDVKTMRPF